MSKTLGELFKYRLLDAFDTNGGLSSTQFAFVKEKSAVDAASEINNTCCLDVKNTFNSKTQLKCKIGVM